MSQQLVDRFQNFEMFVRNSPTKIPDSSLGQYYGVLGEKIKEAEFVTKQVIARLLSPPALRDTAEFVFFGGDKIFLTFCFPIFLKAIAQLVTFKRIVISLGESDGLIDEADLEYIVLPGGEHYLMSQAALMVESVRRYLQPTLGSPLVHGGKGLCFRELIFYPQIWNEEVQPTTTKLL